MRCAKMSGSPHLQRLRNVVSIGLNLVRSSAGGYMHRRAVMALVGGAAISWPQSVNAQQVSKKARIGVFTAAPDNPVMGPASRAFLDEMRRLGFGEGQNLTVEFRRTDRDLSALSA